MCEREALAIPLRAAAGTGRAKAAPCGATRARARGPCPASSFSTGCSVVAATDVQWPPLAPNLSAGTVLVLYLALQ